MLRPTVWLLLLGLGASFFPFAPSAGPVRPPCTPGTGRFTGYSFLEPAIVDEHAAYAPFLLKWQAYYNEVYFKRDLQRQLNVEEWSERFCGLPVLQDVDEIVYATNFAELGDLREAASDLTGRETVPYNLRGNTFAEVLVANHCTEALDYLVYARKCEPHVVNYGNTWTLPERDTGSMQLLIREGLGRFRQTESHFLRLRYAYQIVRLAHYARQWTQAIELYNYLIPKIDRRKPSIIFFWTLGHLAGAYQALGRYPEAAYRYSLIFRHAPSKRVQAFRSFTIRSDADWDKALLLCQSDAERATLHVMRAGKTLRYAVEDMNTIYELDPANPQLELLLVSNIQELEGVFLRTPVTDRRTGTSASAAQREIAANHLLELQKFARRVIRDQRQPDLPLWRALNGYLLQLAGDYYAAGKEYDRVEAALNKREVYDQQLQHQLDVWRLLMQIQQIDPSSPYAEQEAFRLRSYALFRENPQFERFLTDWLSARYAQLRRPGKAAVTTYGFNAMRYNPNPAEISDLLRAVEDNDEAFLEAMVEIDTAAASLRTQLLEMRAVQLFSAGEPEAALLALQSIPPTEQAAMPRFSPFREYFGERVHTPLTDTLLLNRLEIIERLLDYEVRARGAAATNDPVGAWYYYLIGLGYYNMSYFGYEWEAFDYFRSGANWNRLAQGPVFPLRGSPRGNRENIDVSRALQYFERALATSRNSEMAARAAFMAARCQQKQFFADRNTTYRPGSRLIPVLPETYRGYYDLLETRYANTEFYRQMVQECKWLAAYAR